jgi:thiosulfate/3-mercaptopyruvate sulfurtransferase
MHDCIVVDCSHDLTNPSAGRNGYQHVHIPGASFLHQDSDLAGEKNGSNGRHPLPNREVLRNTLRAIGLHHGQQLVAYDAHGGMYASRLWWLAKWMGHGAVAVLDGGLKEWIRQGLPVSSETSEPKVPGDFTASACLANVVTVDQVVANLNSNEFQVVDARAAERYRGDIEPVDPRKGHIPGAINRPFQQNLATEGRFKDAQTLRTEFEAMLAGRDSSSIIHQCGSGVTACHNVLAMEHVGLGGSRLYAGSWSEWIADESRPIQVG